MSQDAPPSAEALDLARASYAFLAAGGRPTFTEWVAFTVAERAALGAAASRLRVEQALRVAQAQSGDAGRDRLAAELDGGVAHDERLMVEAVERIASGLARDRFAGGLGFGASA